METAVSVLERKSAKVPRTYTQLRSALRQTLAAGRRRAQAAVEREKVRTSWQVGKLILDHILFNKKRGAHGTAVMERLAKDLGISYTEIRYMVEFARTYSKRPTWGVLSWGHYKRLLGVNDADARTTISKRAVKADWPVTRLSTEIRKYKRSQLSSPKTLLSVSSRNALSWDLIESLSRSTPAPKHPGTYAVIKDDAGPHKGKLVYDLGFSNYYRPPSSSGLTRESTPAISALYYYHAHITKVIDGDTVWARIDLGFGFTTRQKLRFAKINAREMRSAVSQRAQKYLARKINNKKVLIKTSKSDKYDRYLADVWVGGTYLNSWLVEKGRAVFVK